MIRSLPSRRNQVFLIERAGQLYVEKYFSSAGGAAEEAKIYRLLRKSGLRTPELLEEGGKRIVLSFLEGENYVSLLERQEKEYFSPEPWEALFNWLYGFHQTTGLVQQDVNLRNFLWFRKGAAGLDFEDCGPGSPAGMYIQLCAYVLHYDPAYTDTKKQISAFIQQFMVKHCLCADNDFPALLALEEARLLQRRRRL